MTPRTIAAWAAAVLQAGIVAMLSSCGGGVGSGGTGMEAAVVQGTVSGFGSVIVDGQRVDDRQVGAMREDEPGVERLADVRLGDGVEASLDAAGVATQLRVEAALAGAVDSIAAPSGFVVLGQPVQVNNDPSAGPVTQFAGGYAGMADVMPADVLEVHGVVVPQGGAGVIRATRVEKLPTAPAYLKVSGIVAGLGANAFQIGALTVHVATATVVPAGLSLRNGQAVAVLAPATGRSGSASAPEINAAQVRIRTFGAPGELASVGGSIAALDTLRSTFTLGNLSVHYAGATLSPANRALSNGQYVRVRGRLQPDGSLQADRVTVRDGSAEPEAELKGTIIGLDAATQRFEVRGVTVDAAGAKIEGCPNGVLAEGLFVEVEGDLSATGMRARELSCENEPSGGTVGRKGTVGSVDLAARSFVLTPTSGTPVTVRWTDNTYFEGATPQMLNGLRAEVEGVLEGGVLTAKKVHAED